MIFRQVVNEGVEYIDAEVEPGELVYDASRDVCHFNLNLSGHCIAESMRPREWMAMARAMVEAARAARGER